MVANVRREASQTRAGFLFVSGSRIASWLPSFSVEVMHTTNILGITQASNSQLNAMVRSAHCFQKELINQEGRRSWRVCAVCVTQLVSLCSGKTTVFSGASYSSGPLQFLCSRIEIDLLAGKEWRHRCRGREWDKGESSISTCMLRSARRRAAEKLLCGTGSPVRRSVTTRGGGTGGAEGG